MSSAAKIIRVQKGEDWWKVGREPGPARIVQGKRKLPARLMTVAEVAHRIGTGVWLVYDLIQDGEIDWQPVGRRGKRISEDALLDYLERKKLERRG